MVREVGGEFGFAGWLIRIMITALLAYLIAGFFTAILFAIFGLTIDLGILLLQPADLLKTGEVTAYAAVAIMLSSWLGGMFLIYKLLWSGRSIR